MCSEDLHAWSGEQRESHRRKLLECRRRIQALKLCSDERSSILVTEAREEMCKLLSQQEEYWKQRAKQFWMEAGDLNTTFFHRAASIRKKKKCDIPAPNRCRRVDLLGCVRDQ